MNPAQRDTDLFIVGLGSVRSQEEKNNLQAKAVALARVQNVTNQLESALSKGMESNAHSGGNTNVR